MSTTTLPLSLAESDGPAITPRPYQEDAIQAVLDKHAEGVRRQLGVAATGLGKTIIFVELARRMNQQTIILTHRDELINQAMDKVNLVWPAAHVGVVKAERNEVDNPVVLASIQTLSRPNRMEQMRQKFGLVICDEAHHTAADSWLRVLKHLGCMGDGPGPLLFGVTATPDRGDKAGLAHVFDEISFRYDMRWGIKNDYLCDLRAKEVMLKINLDEVRRSRGDYQDGALGEAMQAANAPEHIVDAWREHAADRRTLAFTPTVEVARELADEYIRQGISANWIYANTPIDERRSILKRFSDGDIQVLANCAVLTEGYDNPAVDCIVLARPTQSRPFYQQMVGRGTRKFPGKTDCLILDVVGVARRHSLATAASLLGVDPKDMEKGFSAKQAIAHDEAPPKPAPRKGTLVASEVDLWEQFKEAEYAWVKTRAGTFALSLSNSMIILQPTGEGWGALVRPREGPERLITPGRGVPVEMAQGIAEDFVRNSESDRLANKQATWRNKPATAKQIETMRKFGYRKFDNDDGSPMYTAGQASDILSARIANLKRR